MHTHIHTTLNYNIQHIIVIIILYDIWFAQMNIDHSHI